MRMNLKKYWMTINLRWKNTSALQYFDRYERNEVQCTFISFSLSFSSLSFHPSDLPSFSLPDSLFGGLHNPSESIQTIRKNDISKYYYSAFLIISQWCYIVMNISSYSSFSSFRYGEDLHWKLFILHKNRHFYCSLDDARCIDRNYLFFSLILRTVWSPDQSRRWTLSCKNSSHA